MAEMIIPIDKAGRLVLPKTLRDRFRLRDGDQLIVQEHDQTIELRPVRPGAKLKKVNGVLVVSAGAPLPSSSDLVREMRDERLAHLSASPRKARG